MKGSKKTNNNRNPSYTYKTLQKSTSISNPDIRESYKLGDIDAREYRLFKSLDLQNSNSVVVSTFLEALSQSGLSRDDYRLAETMKQLEQFGLNDEISYQFFCNLIRPNILLIEQALQGSLVIPDFEEFIGEIAGIFESTKRNTQGEVANYIPQLARINPDYYAMALCTIDGQQYKTGDFSIGFSVQSCCKPILYSLALEEHNEEVVHNFIGREPSGRIFNELTLNEDGKPHNPMINAGAIVCSSMIRSDLDDSERYDYLLDRFKSLCGYKEVQFNNSVYQSERKSGDRNFALGYYMREHKAFPEGTDLLPTLDFYFQSCSIEMDTESLAILASTLANGGVCPLTGERIFKTRNVQHCLSLMCSCGMYDFSGEFAFTIGLPAKSGVAGGLLLVIPNVLGICLWSPRLDSHGNSVRGVEFCKQLVKTFNLHNYDSLTGLSGKKNPRQNSIKEKSEKVSKLIWAASKGDHGAMHHLIVQGFDQDASDYDKRTALHLASAEGSIDVVKYLIDNGAEINPIDRWGGTPLDDAISHNHKEVEKLLKQSGATKGKTSNRKDLSEKHYENVTQLIVNDSDTIVELIYAASEGNLRAIQKMVARGVKLDGADYDWRTPLHLAAAEGHERIVQYFIDQGLNINPIDRWGGTPLDDAKRHGHKRVVKILEGQK
ncbi:MAG: glutaminase A [Candidatus Dadabacteria bacterium]|nr:glutaminase A [Candidatus Dadabacteria bacterium]NIT13136.1 glutaminase A [Candidatus Dadabacteria bacterium]